MAYVIEQSPAPVYVQAQPAVAMIQAPPPVAVIQAPPPVAVIQAPPPVAVIQAPGPVVVQSPMKSHPATTKCYFCQQQVVTVTEPVIGLLIWMVFAGLLIFLIWPFCVIPFFVKSCKDVKHTCPSCNNVLHIYKRI